MKRKWWHAGAASVLGIEIYLLGNANQVLVLKNQMDRKVVTFREKMDNKGIKIKLLQEPAVSNGHESSMIRIVGIQDRRPGGSVVKVTFYIFPTS